jgi:tRNA (mo5U34)-methyltransferase
MSPDQVREEIRKANWYHRYEIVPGVITPGTCHADARGAFDALGLPADLTGKRVLEVGTWDGPYAFELERRGASVVATDIQDPARTAFNTARRILDSKVEYVQCSVYDLAGAVKGPFDIVLFFGVFYHLKHPLMAFEVLASLLKQDGLLVFEGEYFSHYAEDLDNVPARWKLVTALLANSNLPLTLCYPGRFRGAQNWFIPNLACLQGWFKASGFDVISAVSENPIALQRLTRAGRLSWGERIALFKHLFKAERQRIAGIARKRAQVPIEEHAKI